jgi:hypothetical protein
VPALVERGPRSGLVERDEDRWRGARRRFVVATIDDVTLEAPEP